MYYTAKRSNFTPSFNPSLGADIHMWLKCFIVYSSFPTVRKVHFKGVFGSSKIWDELLGRLQRKIRFFHAWINDFDGFWTNFKYVEKNGQNRPKSKGVTLGRFWPFFMIFESCLNMPKTVNSDPENLIFLFQRSEIKSHFIAVFGIQTIGGKVRRFQGQKMAQNGL